MYFYTCIGAWIKALRIFFALQSEIQYPAKRHRFKSQCPPREQVGDGPDNRPGQISGLFIKYLSTLLDECDSSLVSIFRETKHANTEIISHVIITQGS